MTDITIPAGMAQAIASILRDPDTDVDPDFAASVVRLLDPPPTRPVGSLWRDPETGAEYVQTDSTARLEKYRGVSYDRTTFLSKHEREDVKVIARLVPVVPEELSRERVEGILQDAFTRTRASGGFSTVAMARSVANTILGEPR